MDQVMQRTVFVQDPEGRRVRLTRGEVAPDWYDGPLKGDTLDSVRATIPGVVGNHPAFPESAVPLLIGDDVEPGAARLYLTVDQVTELLSLSDTQREALAELSAGDRIGIARAEADAARDRQTLDRTGTQRSLVGGALVVEGDQPGGTDDGGGAGDEDVTPEQRAERVQAAYDELSEAEQDALRDVDGADLVALLELSGDDRRSLVELTDEQRAELVASAQEAKERAEADAQREAEDQALLDGNVNDVLNRVGGDQALIRRALDAEKAKGDGARSTLVTELTKRAGG